MSRKVKARELYDWYEMAQRVGVSKKDINYLKELGAGDPTVQVLIEDSWKYSQLLDICQGALKIVATGIWRKEEFNACGLSGAALAVHAVEEALATLKANMEE